MKQQGAEGPRITLPPSSRSREPTQTDRGSASRLPHHFARTQQGTIRGLRAEEVAALGCYAKWTGRTRGRRKFRTHRFRHLVHRAGRRRDRGPEMEEGWWRRLLEAALPGLDLDDHGEVGSKPRMQLLREPLQREGGY